jgi:hypothetical protein
LIPNGRQTASRPNDKVNSIRERVKHWREGEYQRVTQVTRKLSQHWNDPERENKLFFCQIEALETLVYLTDAARKVGDYWIKNWLRDVNESSNPGPNRVAMKMATGSGKTVVMAMLIAWHALNKIADPKDRRFSDTFLIVTPGNTIRDRLRVLLPNDSENYCPNSWAAGRNWSNASPWSRVETTFAGDISCPRRSRSMWKDDAHLLEMLQAAWHAYFLGADDPYGKLKRALRAEIDEAQWSTLYSTKSYPFDAPKLGKIAVKVINHYGDEALKVYKAVMSHTSAINAKRRRAGVMAQLAIPPSPAPIRPGSSFEARSPTEIRDEK